MARAALTCLGDATDPNGMATAETDPRVLATAYADAVMAAIPDDVWSGVVPWTVTNFGQVCQLVGVISG